MGAEGSSSLDLEQRQWFVDRWGERYVRVATGDPGVFTKHGEFVANNRGNRRRVKRQSKRKGK